MWSIPNVSSLLDLVPYYAACSAQEAITLHQSKCQEANDINHCRSLMSHAYGEMQDFFQEEVFINIWKKRNWSGNANKP